MKLDVYRQIDSQNADTGSIVKSWVYYKTVDCHAKGNISNSSSNTNTDRQSFNNKYKNEQSLQIRTEERITLREKITNIRDMNSNAIWTELNYPSDTPTVFEITGSTPIVDPFGKVIAYNSTATRSENQQIE
jgi:hypothetical protein